MGRLASKYLHLNSFSQNRSSNPFLYSIVLSKVLPEAEFTENAYLNKPNVTPNDNENKGIQGPFSLIQVILKKHLILTVLLKSEKKKQMER